MFIMHLALSLHFLTYFYQCNELFFQLGLGLDIIAMYLAFVYIFISKIILPQEPTMKITLRPRMLIQVVKLFVGDGTVMTLMNWSIYVWNASTYPHLYILEHRTHKIHLQATFHL